MTEIRRILRPKSSLLAAIIVGLILLAGLYFLQRSQAATPAFGIEPETGMLSAGATVVGDSAASGGKAVQFAASTTGPGPKPTGPVGTTGSWTLKFDDEFDGSAIDTSKWNPNEGRSMNHVTTHASNLSVSGGSAILTLASSNSGAMLTSGIVDDSGVNHYILPLGGYTEARINFPGSGKTINNWPAWWTCGNGWPAGGEHDVAEGLGEMTVNYHSPTSSFNNVIPGTWSNAYHVYGLYRKATSVDVYYDGNKVNSYPTSDNGIGHSLIVNIGNGFGPAVYGTASQVKVDYVRAWQ